MQRDDAIMVVEAARANGKGGGLEDEDWIKPMLRGVIAYLYDIDLELVPKQKEKGWS